MRGALGEEMVLSTFLMQQICHADQEVQHSQFGYVIVEANFKAVLASQTPHSPPRTASLRAHQRTTQMFLKTSSRLKVAIVSLFARIDCCLPELVVCSLTQRPAALHRTMLGAPLWVAACRDRSRQIVIS